MSPFPFLLLGLRVWVCFPKSCFVLAAAFAWFHFTGLAATFAWFHFAGPSLPPSLFRGREARESRMPLLPLSLPTPLRAPACLCLHEMYPPHHPGIAWGSTSPSWQPPEEILPSSSPFLCGRPATATLPWDIRAGCQEPPGIRFYIVPPLWSFGEAFRRIVTQPLGPRQSSLTPATLVVTVAVAPRPRDVLLSPEIGFLGF